MENLYFLKKKLQIFLLIDLQSFLESHMLLWHDTVVVIIIITFALLLLDFLSPFNI